jgi:predicted PurR-regulated permease PerM
MAALLFLAVLGAFAAVVVLALPPLVGQVYNFGVAVLGEPAADTPQEYLDLNGNGRRDEGYLADLVAWASSLADRVHDGKHSWYDQALLAFQESAAAKEGVLAGMVGALKTAGGALMGFLWTAHGFVIQSGLVAVYLFFFLIGFDRMVEGVRARLPGRYRARIEAVAGRIDGVVSAFLRGRLIVCVVVGALTALGLALTGIPYWYLIGVATGITGIVPFLPIFVGLVPTVLVAWFDTHSPWVVLAASAVFLGIQILDACVITPLIQGKAVGLHPVTLLVSLLLGWEILGVFGVIAAIPVAATVKILVAEFVLPEVEQLANEPGQRSP